LLVSTSQKQPENYWRKGLSASLVGHVVLALIVFVGVFPNFGDVPEPVVYSISIEGGKNLGAMSQVPKDDKPQQLAPVKNVSAPTQQQPEVKQDEVKPQKEDPVEDAEVSVSETKPTPKPTPTKAPPVKATPTPKNKDSKADPKKSQKSDGDEVDKRLQAALQRYLGESSDGGGKGFGAGRVGGSGMGGGVVRPPEFFVYEKIVRSRIKEAWRWYDTDATLITVIAFDIEPDGVIKNVKLVKTSGDSSYDDSVLRAAAKASPLPAPPKIVYQYFKSVRITFDPRE
jgi:colicin import membrane protein